jgi:hypothetical protein
MTDELRAAIETVQRHLATAEEAGHPYEAHLHRMRLAELEQQRESEPQLLDRS